MRATLRITWLLLSLSLLFHSVRSTTHETNNTTTAKTGASMGPTDAGGKDDSSQPTVPSMSIDAAAAAPATTNASTTTDKPVSAQSTHVPTSPQSLPTSSSGNATSSVVSTPVSTSPAVTQSSVVTTTVPTTVGRSTSLVVSSSNATTTKASEPSDSLVTAPPGPPGHSNLGMTKTTEEEQSTTHTTTLSTTSQEDSKGTTARTTVTATSPKQTTSRTSPPAGVAGTTSTLPTVTKMRLPSADPTSKKTGATSPQTSTSATTAAQPKIFVYSLNNGHENKEDKDLEEVCKKLMASWQNGNCTLAWRHNNGKMQFVFVELNGKVKTNLATQYYEEITKKPTDNKTLIAILASCGALLIMIVILAVCASHHRKPFNENQQHLTEELHTVENGYHDNPTLEVMEVQPEMKEKMMGLNCEFNDSWIVPFDNLVKEEVPDVEDTHL